MSGYVSEMGLFLNRRRHFSTGILRYPSGRFGIAGSVPVVLCEERRGNLVSRVWDTEAEAKAALIEIGCPFFQLADCSWYPREPKGETDKKALDTFCGWD